MRRGAERPAGTGLAAAAGETSSKGPCAPTQKLDRDPRLPHRRHRPRHRPHHARCRRLAPARRRIARRVREQWQIAGWERHAKCMPIIEIAARKYHVKADGMYRMMMRESGGRRFAGADSAFKGLFQYWTGTWAASWNPGRQNSIYDGSSQIFATAYAIHRGMGPQMWTTTFASQY